LYVSETVDETALPLGCRWGMRFLPNPLGYRSAAPVETVSPSVYRSQATVDTRSPDAVDAVPPQLRILPLPLILFQLLVENCTPETRSTTDLQPSHRDWGETKTHCRIVNRNQDRGDRDCVEQTGAVVRRNSPRKKRKKRKKKRKKKTQGMPESRSRGVQSTWPAICARQALKLSGGIGHCIWFFRCERSESVATQVKVLSTLDLQPKVLPYDPRSSESTLHGAGVRAPAALL